MTIPLNSINLTLFKISNLIGSVHYLFLQHVLPLLPHLPHQLDHVRYSIASLNFLQSCIKQTEGASTANTRAVRNINKKNKCTCSSQHLFSLVCVFNIICNVLYVLKYGTCSALRLECVVGAEAGNVRGLLE